MEWSKKSADEYRDKLNKRVAELAQHGVPLHVTGQKAADELLAPEDQASYQKYKEQRFLDAVKAMRK